jgi:hypothetical protein
MEALRALERSAFIQRPVTHEPPLDEYYRRAAAQDQAVERVRARVPEVAVTGAGPRSAA